jgi:putative transposase
MREKLKSNNNVVYSCKYHIIWCPKYRRPILIDAVEKRLKELIYQQATKFNADIIEMEVMPDHVHLLIEVSPQLGIHRFIKNIKGYTSRVLRQEFKTLKTQLPALWTNSYCVITVGGAPLSVIKQYIENQKAA